MPLFAGLSLPHSILFITEYPLTECNVSDLVQRSFSTESENWELAFKCFKADGNEFEDTSHTEVLSNTWLMSQHQSKEWWELGMKLIRCCKSDRINNIHSLMKSVVTYNKEGMCSIVPCKL